MFSEKRGFFNNYRYADSSQLYQNTYGIKQGQSQQTGHELKSIGITKELHGLGMQVKNNVNCK